MKGLSPKKADLEPTDFINPDTGDTVKDGETGELVFITLTKEGLPMIRYRTRDLSRLLPGTARSMRRMVKITDRSNDMIILRGMNIFPSQVEETLLATDGLSPHFQIELFQNGRMDAMRVIVEASPTKADAASREHARKTLAKKIKDTAGMNTEVFVGDPGTVPRSQGKVVRVIDNRQKD